MDPVEIFSPARLVATTKQFRMGVVTSRQLSDAVRAGTLLRVRRGFYALPHTDPRVLEAVRVGGRVSCISAAYRYGIWVPDSPFSHVAMRHGASRLRSPRNRFRALSEHNRDGCELHWWPLAEPSRGSVQSVSLVDALVHIIRCQSRPIAVAALDSALFERKIARADLDAIFATVPKKYAPLRREIDARSMSGLETIVRLIALDAGLRCDLQVAFTGIGIVDLVVAGCVVIETDGRKGHADDAGKLRDYDRDIALAALGYTVLRFNYRQVMFHPERVLAAILAAVRSHRGHSIR